MMEFEHEQKNQLDLTDQFQENSDIQCKINLFNENIWKLEEYLKWQGLMQIDYAATKLGMDTNSFKTVLKNYIEKCTPKTYFTDQVVYKDVVQDITKYLFINVSIFKDHTEYCKKYMKN